MNWKHHVRRQLGADRFIEDEALCQKLSKDYFYYSPILDKKLKHMCAEGVVIARSYEDVEHVLAVAYEAKVPVTIRGAGTGNYGQAVPLYGGIILDLSKLNEIIELGDGYIIVQSGVRLATIDKITRQHNQELRIYPSTYVTATVGGFVCGGSGGIGSITWGNLWDNNILEAKIYTLEQRPRLLTVSGDELLQYIHSYGTIGIIVELKLALAARQEWEQCALQFDTFELAMAFSEELAADQRIMKRLLSVMESPINSFFTPLKKYLNDKHATVLIEVTTSSLPQLKSLLNLYDGEIVYHIEAAGYRKKPGLSDYTWNHTTLWALKSKTPYTYLQADFSLDCYWSQIEAVKQQYRDEVLIHVEWIRVGGKLVPTSLPIVAYTNDERLYEMISFFESQDIIIYDPHTWVLDAGGRGALKSMHAVKQNNDPLSLLNPGKLLLEGS